MSKYKLVEELDEVIENIKKFNEELQTNDELQKQLSQFAQWYYIRELDLFGPSKFISYKNMNAKDYLGTEFIKQAEIKKTERILSKWFVKYDNPFQANNLKESIGEFSEIRVNLQLGFLKSEIEEVIEEMYENNYSIDNNPAIRILPMSSNNPEFTDCSIEEVQEWFLTELPGSPYRFKKGLNTPKGSLVLFQYKNHIIAAADLLNIYEYSSVKDGGYRGHFIFNPSSIRIFNPLTLQDIQLIWNDFKKFSQVQQKLDQKNYDKFIEYIYSKDIRYANDDEMDDETFQNEVEKTTVDVTKVIIDGPKSKYFGEVTTNKSNRNRTISKRVIIEAKYKCEYNASHEFFISEVTGENYVESHHLIPLEFEEMFDFNLDVEANVISLCPICHKKLHHGLFDDKKVIIKKLLSLRKTRLKKCGLEINTKRLQDFYR